MLVKNPKLAIIVPYRDREEHLARFVPHMDKFLSDIDYKIFVIEQDMNITKLKWGIRAEWKNSLIINARSEMIGNLDSIRDLLEELSDDIGVTEPRSGFIKSSINSLRFTLIFGV